MNFGRPSFVSTFMGGRLIVCFSTVENRPDLGNSLPKRTTQSQGVQSAAWLETMRRPARPAELASGDGPPVPSLDSVAPLWRTKSADLECFALGIPCHHLFLCQNSHRRSLKWNLSTHVYSLPGLALLCSLSLLLATPRKDRQKKPDRPRSKLFRNGLPGQHPALEWRPQARVRRYAHPTWDDRPPDTRMCLPPPSDPLKTGSRPKW